METKKEEQPRPVRKLERGGKTESRWHWVEPSVWTDRMLEALEAGVKGGKWHSLIDKVTRESSLKAAWKQVEERKGGGGVDGMSIEVFSMRLDKRIARLSEQLREGTYEPQAVKRVWIPKADGKKRPLGVPTIIDRVVQTSIRNAIEPIFEQMFADCSYGFRPGRGCKDALREVAAELKQGRTWVVDVDIEQYFDSINQKRLMSDVATKIADGSLLDLIESYLEQDVMDGLKRWQPEKGTPQGAVISPLLSNIYLDPLDKLMSEHDYEMIRYADDFVILCQNEQQAQHALDDVGQWMVANGLQLHPEKTRLVDATQRNGFDFLGYHFERGMKWPRKKSMKKLRVNIRKLTRRNNGNSLKRIISNINPILRGWFGFFKHSFWNIFPGVDGWVRMRLRSITRKRRGGKGRGRGNDHLRWNNAYFERLGLYSTTKARARLLNPATR